MSVLSAVEPIGSPNGRNSSFLNSFNDFVSDSSLCRELDNNSVKHCDVEQKRTGH